jgi:hypothetical protein
VSFPHRDAGAKKFGKPSIGYRQIVQRCGQAAVRLKARLRLAQSRGMLFSVGSFASKSPFCIFSRWTLRLEYQEW